MTAYVQTTHRRSPCQTHILKQSPEMPGWFILGYY